MHFKKKLNGCKTHTTKNAFLLLPVVIIYIFFCKLLVLNFQFLVEKKIEYMKKDAFSVILSLDTFQFHQLKTTTTASVTTTNLVQQSTFYTFIINLVLWSQTIQSDCTLVCSTHCVPSANLQVVQQQQKSLIENLLLKLLAQNLKNILIF